MQQCLKLTALAAALFVDGACSRTGCAARQARLSGYGAPGKRQCQLCRLSPWLAAWLVRYRARCQQSGDRCKCFEHDSSDGAAARAAFGNPGVPSPTLRVSARSSGGTESSDRLDFGAVPAGQTSARGFVRLANDCALPIQLASSVRIVGPHAGEYALADSGCATAATLGPAQSCEIGIIFRPAPGGAGLRSGAVQVDHNWVGGTAAVALLGTAEATAANPPVGGSGGGGALVSWLLILVAGIAWCRASAAPMASAAVHDRDKRAR